MKQLLLDIAPAPEPSLVNFVAGRNSELLTVLRDLAGNAHGKRSLYIWGGTGSGRSHLLKAAHAHFIQTGLKDGELSIVDDIETTDDATQIALFNRFNELRDSGGAFIAAGPCAPIQLDIRDDLRTRLGWGLVYQVFALSDAEKAEALQRHAAERGFRLPGDVVDYLLRHVRRDLPSLMGMLDALDEWSLTAKRPVTVPLLRQLLQLPLKLD